MLPYGFNLYKQSQEEGDYGDPDQDRNQEEALRGQLPGPDLRGVPRQT